MRTALSPPGMRGASSGRQPGMGGPTPFADAARKHPHNDMNGDLFRNSVGFIYTFTDICRK